MESQIYSLLGLSQKARKIITGQLLITAIKAQKVFLVITTGQIGTSQEKMFNQKCYYYKIPYFNRLDTEALSTAIGKQNCKAIGISDQQLATRIIELLTN
ncbi:L7Ae/L30e/S12e/Gadd45 family ribosomal protein [Spiroplasma sp. DGKH1]|uniref:L7Ae/L30e/S12e/Gadd45 family ribosomal protein n=1 Tax=Spiroplasma sp. DGKH1 TaxID=3050074 RepID=UPI0034C6CC4B